MIYEALTWNDISGIHCIFILDEPKTVHELDFGYLASAMSSKMRLDVLLIDYEANLVQHRPGLRESQLLGTTTGFPTRRRLVILTALGQIAQIQPCRRHLGGSHRENCRGACDPKEPGKE